MQFSSLMKVEPSVTVAINTAALAKKAKGERVYNLSAGEPMVPVHPSISAAIEQAVREDKVHYPPANGIPELRDAFAEWMNKQYQTNFTSEQTLVTCGGKFGIYAACQALINPGDEVIIIAPYWVSYTEIVKMFGGVPRTVPTPTETWKAAPEILKNFVTPNTKLLFINNGGNPTGALYAREELGALLAFAQQHSLVVISDEVYSGLAYDGEFVSSGSFPEYADRVLVVQSASKHFGLTGLRAGFALGPVELIKKMSVIQSQSTTGTASISQWGVLGAVQHADEVVRAVNSAMRTRRDVFVKKFSELFAPITPPAAALYVFVSLRSLGVSETDSSAFCTRLLNEGNVATVPGSAFGQEGYIRFSFGAEEKELEASLEALKHYVDLSFRTL